MCGIENKVFNIIDDSIFSERMIIMKKIISFVLVTFFAALCPLAAMAQ